MSETLSREDYDCILGLCRVYCASKLPPGGTSFEPEDLLTDAWLGLRSAKRNFDPTRGVPFRGYAHRRIMGAITDGFRNRAQMRQGVHLTSLEGLTFHESGDRVPVDNIQSLPAQDSAAEDAVENEDLVLWASRGLPMRSRVVLHLRYDHSWHLKRIGKFFGVSEARVSQLVHEALEQMRLRMLESKG